MKNLLVISDGNGVDGSDSVKGDTVRWPRYLKLLSPSLNIINKSVVGGGNEIMFMQLAQVINQNNIDYAIIQWSVPRRLDIVANEFWLHQAEIDPTYSFNIVNAGGEDWWVTSNSFNKYVKEYHNNYIGYWQAAQRSQSYMLAAAHLLEKHNIKYKFSLCYQFDFIYPLKDSMSNLNWVWHESYKGISEYRHTSQYAYLDAGTPRPHTLIHLDWIDKVLAPACDFIDYDSKRYYNMEQFILKKYT
jgi:hypothetical protein